jgi:hypothetical protein
MPRKGGNSGRNVLQPKQYRNTRQDVIHTLVADRGGKDTLNGVPNDKNDIVRGTRLPHALFGSYCL